MHTFQQSLSGPETTVWLDHTQAEIDNNDVYDATMVPDVIRESK